MSEPWTEEAADERYLDDLELEETAAQVVRARLAEPPVGPDAREARFREAAQRWLDRGQAQVALALLDRSTSGGPVGALTIDPRRDVPVDALLATLPGLGGLPALTGDEAEALRSAETPEEALVVLRRARDRLETHGVEARRLLQRWVERG